MAPVGKLAPQKNALTSASYHCSCISSRDNKSLHIKQPCPAIFNIPTFDPDTATAQAGVSQNSYVLINWLEGLECDGTVQYLV